MPKLSDLLARSKAAKGSQKELPPMPEEEMPVEEPMPEEAPVSEPMPEAGGGEEMPPPMPEDAPMPEEAAAGPDDVDMWLANGETFVEGLDPEIQEEVRTHLNAIRDLIGSGGTPEEGAPPEEAPEPELPMPPDAKAPEGVGL